MEKLKKVIQQLNGKDFTQIKSVLEKNNSEKFLHVLVSYSENETSDDAIREYINCSEGAYYVLKSRLLDKIQELLVENNDAHRPALLKDGSTLTQYLYERPRETAISILHQLEKVYVHNDTPQELISVYSALKKTHYHSDKYYYYSQLYNKHIAYTVALEKAEDVLLNFNRTLANYYFSKSSDDVELLQVLLKEIKNIYSLNQSHRFELIKNIMLVQAQLFANCDHTEEEELEGLLKRCEDIVDEFTEDKQIKYYALVVNYFWFEYYLKINQVKKAVHYYEVINKNSKNWLLLGNYCIAFKFLLSRPQLLNKLNRINELKDETLLFDNYDFYTQITIKFCKAITNVYEKNYNRSIDVLNELIRDISLHHFFHFEIETKLTLAFLYISQGKNEKGERIIKSINRKINVDRKDEYQNGVLFMKLLNMLMDENKTTTGKSKIVKALNAFNDCNSGERKILAYLQPEIEGFIKQL